MGGRIDTLGSAQLQLFHACIVDPVAWAKSCFGSDAKDSQPWVEDCYRAAICRASLGEERYLVASVSPAGMEGKYYRDPVRRSWRSG